MADHRVRTGGHRPPDALARHRVHDHAGHLGRVMETLAGGGRDDGDDGAGDRPGHRLGVVPVAVCDRGEGRGVGKGFGPAGEGGDPVAAAAMFTRSPRRRSAAGRAP